MPAIKARMKDLESAWDLNKARLQGLDAEAWGSIDKSIDRALAPLRTAAPEQQASVSALQALLGKINNK
jgi:hypothetical protein